MQNHLFSLFKFHFLFEQVKLHDKLIKKSSLPDYTITVFGHIRQKTDRSTKYCISNLKSYGVQIKYFLDASRADKRTGLTRFHINTGKSSDFHIKNTYIGARINKYFIGNCLTADYFNWNYRAEHISSVTRVLELHAWEPPT